MDPYRSDHSARASAADIPRDQGIVGDIIAQFADPLAFYRELIQNSIDAGSPSVEVKLDYDHSASVVRVAVRDRGEGMTRDILENQLLVLFRSTKEKDSSKIGKFGIGFTSVLSPNPEVVVVQTARDGRRLTLHLMRDLTYQLFDAGPATQTGTTVELDLAMRADELEAFAQRSIDALTRCCRHASVPVTFTALLPGGGKREARIDRPLGLENALVEVTRSTDDGTLTVVAGLLPQATSYLGYFNHGLMLHETAESPLGRVAVKIQDGRLGHTLSRDDVRRDANLDRALAFARDVIADALPRAAETALHQSAQQDHARWFLLASAICAAKLELTRAAWWFPLLQTSGQALAIDGDGLGSTAWVTDVPSPITAHLIERGERVLRVIGERSFLGAITETIASCKLRDVESLTAVTPIPATDADTALLAIMNELFAKAHRAPTALFVANFYGKHVDTLALSCEASDGTQVIESAQAGKNPFGRRTQALALSSRHPWYRAALAGDPRAGASLLVRVLLNEHGLLDTSRSTALLDDVLERIGVRT